MKKLHTFKFFTSLFFLLLFVDGFGQQKTDSIIKDSIIYKTNYGLRLGIDVSKPIRAILQDNYTGLEFTADYRISKKWYIAGEIGTEEFTTKEDFTNSTSKGSYIRMGVNFNAYNNWLDMNNEIFVGFRYGFATFEQTLNSYQINTIGNPFPSPVITTPITEEGLNAHWGEIQLGFKAEVFNNLFLTVSGAYKIMVSVNDPTNFKVHYAPGFNRVYASNNGFGFNYTISYLIPFRKK